MDRRLELNTLSSAETWVTISGPLVEQLKTLHKGKVVYSVFNGFDPKEVNNGRRQLTNKFTITYTGQIYRGKQDTSKILKDLKNLIPEGIINPKDIEVRFYGCEEAQLARDIKVYELTNLVKQFGKMFSKNREDYNFFCYLIGKMNWKQVLSN